VEPTFIRGQRNNGFIEIISDPDDGTDSEDHFVLMPQPILLVFTQGEEVAELAERLF
jgi:hypothetical protein